MSHPTLERRAAADAYNTSRARRAPPAVPIRREHRYGLGFRAPQQPRRPAGDVAAGEPAREEGLRMALGWEGAPDAAALPPHSASAGSGARRAGERRGPAGPLAPADEPRAQEQGWVDEAAYNGEEYPAHADDARGAVRAAQNSIDEEEEQAARAARALNQEQLSDEGADSAEEKEEEEAEDEAEEDDTVEEKEEEEEDSTQTQSEEEKETEDTNTEGEKEEESAESEEEEKEQESDSSEADERAVAVQAGFDRVAARSGERRYREEADGYGESWGEQRGREY